MAAFGMIFENIPCAFASELHAALEDHEGYRCPERTVIAIV